MSCNGCRVLRKGCSESCVLRTCLHWIPTPEAQGHATLFLAKFFGRGDLLSLISTIPKPQRPALFQSLLFEACGRTVNPIGGAVGLLSSGNWHVCRAAVDTVLNGGASTLRPLPEVINGTLTGDVNIFDGTSDTDSTTNASSGQSLKNQCMSPSVQVVDINVPLYDPNLTNLTAKKRRGKRSYMATSFGSDMSEVINEDTEISGFNYHNQGGHEIKLLDLFV